MYKRLPKEYQKKFNEIFKKRNHWIGLVIYDTILIAFVLTREEKTNCISLSSLKYAVSNGIRKGRIVNSTKASEAILHLLTSITEESGIKDNRVLIGLDIPCLRITPKHWTDESARKSQCSETTYKRILNNIIRETTFDNQHIIDLIPTRIFVDGRLVEDDPCGLTGQISMESNLISISNEDKNDFENCLNRIHFRCENFFSGFTNLSYAFSNFAKENEHALLLDLKYNSVDVILFHGNQPLTMKCYHKGLEEIIIENVSAVLSIGMNAVYKIFTKYCESGTDKDSIVFEIDSSISEMELKYWELHEMIMCQMKNFIFMENGIKDQIMNLQRDAKASPRKLFITGEGSNIPEICELFEKRLNLKSEIINWSSPDGKSNLPACVYGMAQDISTDAGGVNLFMQDKDEQKFNF
jgi:cell division ATPase FtsA